MTEAQRSSVILMPVFAARPGLGPTLELELDLLQKASRGEAGCIAYSVFADVADPDRFILFEEWGSQADLDTHNRQVHVRRFSDRVAEWLVRPLEVTRLRSVTVRPEG